jgi:hypothetical protein
MSKKINLNAEVNETEIIADEHFTLKSYNGLPYKGNEAEFNATTNYNNIVKKQALKFLADTVKANKDTFDSISSRIAYAIEAIYRPRQAGTGSKKAENSNTSMVSALFVNVGDTFDEGQIFMQLKLGRLEMKNISRMLIKNAKTPESRKWVSFDAVSGIYKLEAVGAEPPANWKGYLPTEKEIEVSEDVDGVSLNND